MARPINPAGYSAEAKAEICEHVIEELKRGERGVSAIIAQDEGMPSIATFYAWLDADPELFERIERAREIAATKLLEEIPEIADNVATEKDAIAKAKLRIYARESFAAKIAPKRFGAKVDLTSGGEKIEPAQVNDNRMQALVQLAAKRKLGEIEDQSEEP